MSSSMLAVSNEEKIAAMEAESFGGTHCGAITGIPPTTVRELKSLWTVRDEGLLTDDQEERVRGWRGKCLIYMASIQTYHHSSGSHPS